MTLQNGRRRKEMPTKAKIKKKPKRNTWVYIYGDEMLEIWEHFGIDFPNPDDRMKLKFVKYESKEMQRG